MRTKKLLLIAILAVFIMFLFDITSYAGSQEWNSLNYDVKLEDNGDMDVIETWDINISNTNTLFKTFDLDNNKYSGITNVEVYDLTNNIALKRINQEMYHVTKNCYYGLKINNKQFEIAWGVGADTTSITRKYRVQYTITNAVTDYEDCSELYWMFLSKTNGISAKEVTGTIKLPSQVSNIDNLKVWAHGPLNGKIEKKSNDTVYFEIENFPNNKMLETRIVVTENIFKNNTKIRNYNYLDTILKEEKKDSTVANIKRLFVWAIILIYAYILIKNIFKIIELKRQITPEVIERIENEQVNNKKYYRDIPRNDATPAEAVYIKNFNVNNSYSNESAILSSTMMDLCLKGYIEFTKNEKDTLITLKRREDLELLKRDEKSIYILLQEAAMNENMLTISELKKFAKKKYIQVIGRIQGISKISKSSHEQIGNIDKEEIRDFNNLNGKKNGYIAIIIFIAILSLILIPSVAGRITILPLIMLGLPLFIEIIIKISIYGKLAKQYNGLTEKGKEEKEQWIGLYNYMKDYSLLSEKDITDLVLWEKYLIFSTAFGISGTVIKRFKEIIESANIAQNYDMTDTRFLLINQMMINDTIDTNIFSSISNEINSVYSAATSAASAASGGSGGGGGFSGGGGGRRRWRPVADGR